MAKGEPTDPGVSELQRIARHEVAHALAAHAFAAAGLGPGDIDLDAQLSANGLGAAHVTLANPSGHEGRQAQVNAAMMSLIVICAGAASDAAERREPLLQAWAYQEADQAMATRVLDVAKILPAERNSLTGEALNNAAEFVEQMRDDIHSLARLLMEKRRLSKEDVLAWCKQSRPSDGNHALAIHEAAHAVVGEALGLTLLSIKIDFDQWQGGATFDRGFGPEVWRRGSRVEPCRRDGPAPRRS